MRSMNRKAGIGIILGVGIGFAAYLVRSNKLNNKAQNTVMKDNTTTSAANIIKDKVKVVLEELKKPWIHIRDFDYVEKAITDLIRDGKEKLQVIADFDRTLTRYAQNGEILPTSHGILENAAIMPETYKNQADELREKYYAIEVDPLLTMAEKCPFMVEWWTKAHALMVQYNIQKGSIKNMVSQSNVKLRDGVDWMFEELHKADVPCLIFSAGVGDVIEEVLHQRARVTDNMKIVSNFMEFNSTGSIQGFHGDMIHVFNKNENSIHDSDYFGTLSQRENLILLGDSAGDIRMAEGAPAKQVLKIGYLNYKAQENLEKFKELYDIVLVGDETMNLCNSLLIHILQ